MAKGPQTLFKGSFHDGVVRDVARHLLGPAAVYNAVDLLLHVPGVAEKRGGWGRQSLQLGSSTYVKAVSSIHNPTRVFAVGSDGTLYDTTSENALQATSITTCTAPIENPPLYTGPTNGGQRIFCYPDQSASPKVVYYSTGGSTLAVGNLFGSSSLPHALHSVVHNSFVALANDDDTTANVLYFWPDPDLEPDVDTDDVSLEVTSEVLGLASVGGVLLVLGPDSIERIVGSIPPGRVGEDMARQPLESGTGAGCVDARSIVHMPGGVVFANAAGVWQCNGSGVWSLTAGTIGATYWRDLFPQHAFNTKDGRYISAGSFGDFYVVTLLDRGTTPAPVTGGSLMCHVPTRRWMRLSNTFGYMFANGRDEQELPDLYMANASEGYVAKLAPMFRTATYTNQADGDGTVVAPVLEVVFGDGGTRKKFNGGRVSFLMSVGTQSSWAASHVYAVNDLIEANSQVWKVTARSGDFKSGSVEPSWSTQTTVGGTLADNHVTWTNMGPQLAVATSYGVETSGSFTTNNTFTAGETPRRVEFDANDTDQVVSVRFTQTGGSARTAIYGVELDVVPQDGAVVTDA